MIQINYIINILLRQISKSNQNNSEFDQKNWSLNSIRIDSRIWPKFKNEASTFQNFKLKMQLWFKFNNNIPKIAAIMLHILVKKFFWNICKQSMEIVFFLDCIIWLLLSLLIWPKVIHLRVRHCVIIFWLFDKHNLMCMK